MAAVLTERAGRQNQPSDLIAALELLEEALRHKPATPWLLFNRALVLEKLQLVTQARQAWSRYLDAESGSPWMAEARIHAVGLELRVESQAEPVDELLRHASEVVNTGALVDLAELYPRESREFAVEVALVRWGEATFADRRGEAGRWLAAGRILGEELARLGGDQTVIEAARAIESAQRRSPEAERELARAHKLYGQGHRLYQKRDYPNAAPLLAEAHSVLASAGSPVAGWAEFDLGVIALHNNQNERTVAVLSPLLTDCGPARYPSLCGRTAWALGLALFRLGRLAEALGAYRTAAATFQPARERDSHAAVLGLVAETLRELGDTPSAWQHRYRALRVLGGQTRHRSSHNLLWEAGDAALEEGYPLAAELFVDEDVALFSAGEDRLLALESYFRRALFRRGRAPASVILADLNRARAISRELPSSPLLPRIEADVQLALAELAAEESLAEAETAMSRALKFFRRHKLVLREAATLLARARVRKAHGSILQAQDDLAAAVRLFENQREQLDQGADRRLYSETWQGIYDELIEFAAGRPDGAMDALSLLESSRAGTEPSLSPPGTSTVILTYAATDDALYRFRIEGGQLDLARLPASRTDLASGVRAFADALRFGVGTEPASIKLARLLIPDGLAEGARLCFVPDREIAGVPFAALPLQDGSGPLLTRHEVMLADSVNACMAADPRLAPSAFGRGILIFGSPKLDRREFPWLSDLTGATEETDSLQDFYPNATLLAGEAATAPALLKALPGVTLLHFAGHAVAHPTDSGRGFLPLAPDPTWSRASLLSGAEIAKLHLPNLELAVLSACDTFTPRPRRAEGISGLVRALLDAGARAVVGTLWKVDDRASRELLIEFHRNLRGTGDVASALRAAQLHMLRQADPRLREPSTWAAFELVVRPRDGVSP
ncbi:MAG TPA: CHAT domain-containing tetratricopeptide repeat protein [Thermoanaerobaculia bacterium]